MCRVKSVFQISLCVFISGLLSGCAQPVLKTKTADISLVKRLQNSVRPGFDTVYEPKLQTDKSFDINDNQLADDIKRSYCFVTEAHGNFCLTNLNVIVEDKRIDISGDLEGRSYNYSFTFETIEGRITVDVIRGVDNPYIVAMFGQLYFKDLVDAQKLADDLFSLQQNLKKQKEAKDALFEAQAAQYRALPVKPKVSEDQRKFIVQANALSQQKEYVRAMNMYKKALQLDPSSYPEAYFNMALLSAQAGGFQYAISYMKKYLLLVPDAKDARSAQDKIYEWEIMVPK